MQNIYPGIDICQVDSLAMRYIVDSSATQEKYMNATNNIVKYHINWEAKAERETPPHYEAIKSLKQILRELKESEVNTF